MAKGHKTGGRPKGGLNKTTLIKAEKLKSIEDKGEMPLDVMLGNMRRANHMAAVAERETIEFAKDALSKLDGEDLLNALIAQAKKTLGLRTFAQDCARDAAPYVHSRLATTVVKGDADNPIKAAIEISFVKPRVE